MCAGWDSCGNSITQLTEAWWRMNASVSYYLNQCLFNTLRLRQDGHHFPVDIFICISWISLLCCLVMISYNRVHYGLKVPFVCLCITVSHFRHYADSPDSPGYLLIYPPQIATVIKPISFCSKYNPVSHTKSLGESQEWNIVFKGSI